MKDFADDNLKFKENVRKLFKPVENTVGKGEIARYEQFLLFPQCFQKACFLGASKGIIVWEWVKQVWIVLIPQVGNPKILMQVNLVHRCYYNKHSVSTACNTKHAILADDFLRTKHPTRHKD